MLTNARAEGLHPEDHRSVVRPDVGADRGRRAGGDSRHREHADRVDHRSPARARRAAGGRRPARPDPADDLDRGAQHRRARAGARASRSARSTCTTSCRSCTTTSPACGSTTQFPVDGRRWRWCRRFSAPRSSRRSGRRNRRCTARWWRRWNMSSRYSYSSASTSRARTADSPGPIAATNEAARIVGMVRSTNATGNT